MSATLSFARNTRLRHGLPHSGPQPGAVSACYFYMQGGKPQPSPQYNEYFLLDKSQPHDRDTLFAICIAHAAEAIAAYPTIEADVYAFAPLDAKHNNIGLSQMSVRVNRNGLANVFDTCGVTPEIVQLAQTVRGVNRLPATDASAEYSGINFSAITASVAEHYRDARYGYHKFGFGIFGTGL